MDKKRAAEITIEELIPHRGRMKLIHSIVRVDEHSAETESVAAADWPLVEGGAVSPLVLIELAAQTIGVSMGWKESVLKGCSIEGRLGWLVGVKEARFYVDSIPVNSRITTYSERDVGFQNYYEVLGTSRIGTRVIGEVRLQIVYPDPDETPT